MKLGNIKLQALSLISPDLSVECDDEKLSDALYALRLNSNCASYLVASVGAINRAFAQIEGRLLSGIGIISFDLSKENIKNGVITLDDTDEILKINQVKIGGVSMSFDVIGNFQIKVDYTLNSGRCEITYFKKIKRINLLTGASYEVDLGSIEEFIPYYIKYELLCSENPDEAENAREVFENALNNYEKIGGNSTFADSVYSLRRI